MKIHASGECRRSSGEHGLGADPVFNLQPDPGHVATLAASLLIATIPIEIDLVPNSNGQYHLTATISDTSSLLTLEGADLTLWGVPGDPSHDSQRCGQIAQKLRAVRRSDQAFMTNPTNCFGWSADDDAIGRLVGGPERRDHPQRDLHGAEWL